MNKLRTAVRAGEARKWHCENAALSGKIFAGRKLPRGMRRFFFIFAAALATFAAFAVPPSRIFVDSLGRKVELPLQIDRVAVAGPIAQVAVFALAPETLAGLASPWGKSGADYLDARHLSLPVLGQIYGGRGTLNVETLVASGAQILVDVGDERGGLKSDLDGLQSRLGIPVVHIEGGIAALDAVFPPLGEILGKKAEAKRLSDYLKKNLARAKRIAGGTQKKRAVFCLGADGLNVIAKGTLYAKLLDVVFDNVAEISPASNAGTGSKIDIEQMLAFNPDVIFFDQNSIAGEVEGRKEWREISALKNHEVYRVPAVNIYGFKSSVNEFAFISLVWALRILYPERCDFSIEDELKEYFSLFFHCELSDEKAAEILGL